MIFEYKMPPLGKKTKSVDIIAVRVSPGDTVTKDQPLLEIESDKGTADVTSPVAGRITEMRVQENGKLESGQLIALIETDEAPAKDHENEKPEAPAQADRKEAKPEPKPSAPPPQPQPAPKPAAPAPRPALVPRAEQRPTEDGKVVRAGPATRKRARKLGVDLRLVRGSGRDGRITEEDVEDYVKRRLQGPAAGAGVGIEVPELPDFGAWGEIERQPLSKVRRLTAQHMSLCWNLIPHVTQHDVADVTDLENFRQQQKAAGVKLTVTAFALKASAIALKRFPEFNATLDLPNNQLILMRYYHIGVAVDTEHGLLVPVLRDVDKKSVEDLSRELVQAAEAARQRRADMEGGTFTISNLGGIGGTAFTPIVNWPQVAILGMSRSAPQPAMRDGQLTSRLMLPLSLSYDHRVIDGAAAARFTRFLAELLENPWKMVLHG
jgi:pyruvate dehydrogenase E2 component (dihydrolipoamide acetyltransferase)